MTNAQELRKQYRTAVIVALAMIQGCVFFGAIVYFLIVNGTGSPEMDNGLLRNVVLVLGFGVLMGSVQLKKALLASKSDESIAGEINLDLIPVSRIMTAMIVSMALIEGAVLFGLVAALLSRNVQDLIAPVIIGLIGFSAHFPRYADWEKKSIRSF